MLGTCEHFQRLFSCLCDCTLLMLLSASRRTLVAQVHNRFGSNRLFEGPSSRAESHRPLPGWLGGVDSEVARGFTVWASTAGVPSVPAGNLDFPDYPCLAGLWGTAADISAGAGVPLVDRWFDDVLADLVDCRDLWRLSLGPFLHISAR